MKHPTQFRMVDIHMGGCHHSQNYIIRLLKGEKERGYASVTKFTLHLAQNMLCILCVDMSVRAFPHSGILCVPMALPMRAAHAQ